MRGHHPIMQHLFARTTTTTAAAVAVVALGTIAVTAAVVAKKRKQWNSEKGRIQRENFRRTTATTLVGPKPRNRNVDDLLRKQQQQSPPATNYYLVIIHGFGCTSLEFGQFIQLLQSQTTTTTSINIFTYDRVLFVKEDDDQCQENKLFTKPRDAVTLAQELHALLQNRQEVPHPSYLLIGHSYGGLIAQIYASMYPDQVHGMVLIDPAHEEQFQTFPRDFTVSFTTIVPCILNLYQRIAWTGVLMWLDQWSLFNFPPLFLLQPPPPPPPRRDTTTNPVRRACAQLYSDGSVWKIVSAELQGCMETFDRINHHHGDDDDDHDGGGYKFRRRQQQQEQIVPTSLVIAGNRRYSPTLFPRKVTRAFLEMHATCLSHAKVFIAQDSDHWVHMSEPKVVLEAVQYVVNELKKKRH